MDDESWTPRPLVLSPEQRAVLDSLCLYHEKGLNHPRVVVKKWRVFLLITCLFAIAASVTVFANRIPLFYSTLLAGFLLGWIVTIVRSQRSFKRQWPVLEAIIDWKLAGRLRRETGPSVAEV